MVFIFKYIYQQLTDEVEYLDGPEYAFPLHGAPMPLVLISLAYVTFVFKIGPYLMRKRQPFVLRNVMLIYNAAQVIMSCIYVLLVVYLVLTANVHDLGCIVKMPTEHPLKSLEIKLFYSYFLIKILDYMDTIFFVLRKSSKQVTFLHVYHHLLMVNGYYLHIRTYGTGGQPLVTITLNSFVHSFMYAYYFISVLRPNIKQSITWKKYITQLQLGQFVIILGQILWTLIARPDCPYPRTWLWGSAFQCVVMIYLFGNFYRRAYFKKVENSLFAKKETKTS